MSDKLHEDSLRAQRAQQLMDDELMVEAFASLETEYIAFWKKTPVRDTDARERLWQQIRNLDLLKGHFEKIISNGKLAQKQLDDIVNLGERRKILGVV